MPSALTTSPDSGFDFQAHRSKSVEQYRPVRGTYEAFANVVRDILLVAIPKEVQLHSVQCRAKALDSFGDKACRPSDQDRNIPQYPEPLSQITDLAGVRVIVFFPKTLDTVNQIINDEFNVVEKTDKSEELIASDKFGYQSIHYLVKLKSTRTSLPEYGRYQELTAEIQVRTILQHAWAEMEHDIQYKSVNEIPLSIRRRFMSLAGMLEIADKEFQAIQDEDERRRERDRSTVQEGLDGVVDLKQKAARLETQLRETRESRPSASTYLSGSARALVDKGYFEEAVRAYDQVISMHPTVHTNYIGRARAKFLAGDAEGALLDLSKAEELHPFDAVIERLRLEFGGGQRARSSQQPTFVQLPLDNNGVLHGHFSPAQQAVWEGNNRLAQGDAAGAFANYTRAQELGWSEVYSMFNQAMALVLAKHKEEATNLLGSITPDNGSYMEINVLALRCICSLLARSQDSTCLSELKLVARSREFDYRRSQLKFLEKGSETKADLVDLFAPVFKVLRDED